MNIWLYTCRPLEEKIQSSTTQLLLSSLYKSFLKKEAKLMIVKRWPWIESTYTYMWRLDSVFIDAAAGSYHFSIYAPINSPELSWSLVTQTKNSQSPIWATYSLWYEGTCLKCIFSLFFSIINLISIIFLLLLIFVSDYK